MFLNKKQSLLIPYRFFINDWDSITNTASTSHYYTYMCLARSRSSRYIPCRRIAHTAQHKLLEELR